MAWNGDPNINSSKNPVQKRKPKKTLPFEIGAEVTVPNIDGDADRHEKCLAVQFVSAHQNETTRSRIRQPGLITNYNIW